MWESKIIVVLQPYGRIVLKRMCVYEQMEGSRDKNSILGFLKKLSIYKSIIKYKNEMSLILWTEI